jgi:outer membrane receptor protein involved in Fe transport
MKGIIPRLIVALLVLAVAEQASAQITGSIRGTARDEQGALLPGVTVTPSSTALKRHGVYSTTADNGTYLLVALPAGTYQIDFELAGFATRTVVGVQLGLDQILQVDVVLQLAGVEEAITVTAEHPLVEVKSSALALDVHTEVIDSMPLNGRQFLDLVGLVPGVAPRPAVSDQGAGVTVFGERSITNSYLVDGMENNDDFTRNFGETYVQDTIQEFKVNLGGYTAQYGRASGAVANVITRSGTNDMQGRAFYFIRDDALDSSNIEGQDPPELGRHEIGGTLGGPIVRDRTWFFGSYQYLRETRGNNFDLSLIPDIIKDGYFSPTTGGEDFTTSPELRNSIIFFKVNHEFSGRHTLFGTTNINLGTRGNFIPPPEKAVGTPPPGSIALPSTASDIESNSYSFTVRDTLFFGPQAFLESSFRYLRLRFQDNAEKVLGAEQLFPGTFSGTGATFWLTNATSVGITDRTNQRFQWTENFSYFKGSGGGGTHDFKFGWDYNYIDLDNFFTIPNTMIIANPAINADYQNLGLDVTIHFSENVRDKDLVQVSNNVIAAFAQDTWEVSPGLTLNLGLRYDWSSLFGDDANNLGPRLGVAWDPGNDGRTVVRASWGLYYDTNILEVATTIPSFGGVQSSSWQFKLIPRGASFFNNPGIGAFGPLEAGGTRWLANPKLFTSLLPEGLQFSSGNLSITGEGEPYVIYDVLGIPVPDPSRPPVISRDSITELTGGRLTPDQALAILNAEFPGDPSVGFAEDQFFWFEPIEGSILTQPHLAFRFRQPGPVITSINTVQEPVKTPFTSSFNFGVERQLTNNLSIDAQVFIRRSKDLLTRRVVNLLPRDQLVSTSCAGNTVDRGPCQSELQYIGFLDANVFLFALKRPVANGFGFLASYTFTDATDNFATLRVPPPGAQTSFLFSNEPELDDGRSLNTPEHVFVLSGLWQGPYGIDISGILKTTSGYPFNAAGLPQDSDGDQIFDNRLIGTEKGEFATDYFLQLDLRLAKWFSIGDTQRLTVLVEFFNLTNRANPFRVNTSFGTDAFGATIEPLPGREIQFGFRYDF